MFVEPRYRRIVLKVSGESLGGSHSPVDIDRMTEVAQSIRTVCKMGVTTTVIVGGGNIFRGGSAKAWELDRLQADEAGMAATGVNAILLQGILESMAVRTEIFSRGPCNGIGIPYSGEELRAALSDGQVGILAGGMGISGFSTDVPAVHAAIDTMAEVVIMSKHGTDGVYNDDPRVVKNARFLPSLSASQALARKLRVMDSTALSLARDHSKYIHVVPAADPNSVQYAVEGKEVGSVITPQ
ncbi:amino acid kinase family protein [Actinomadura napierensis]|uniref:Uridylate kinase n=1 Tax=Actinomadura napierensis TaxID=267854 RepID=A0ABP5K8K0_9ACTN